MPKLNKADVGSQPSGASVAKLPFGKDAMPAAPAEPDLEDVADPVSADKAAIPSTSDAAYAKLNTQLAELYALLPAKTALVIFSGHGDPREMSKLSAKKNRFDRLWKTVKPHEITAEDRWMEEDDRNLQAEVDKCRLAASFFCVKG